MVEEKIIDESCATVLLVVEDNDFDFELVERRLRKISASYIVNRASSAAEFEAWLSSSTPDIILSDFSLPAYSGLEALEFAKRMRPEVPFIFVSGSIGEERAVEALKQGASDYVLKDNLNKLEPAVRRALDEVKEKNRRKEAEEKVKIKNKELRALVYRISHDFKAPVCTIQGAVNLFSLAENKEEFLKYGKMIESVTLKLDGIIKNLSNFQYLFADEILPKKVNIEQILSEAVGAVTGLEECKKVRLSIDLEGEPEVFSERHFLFSILYNLIYNSLVFSDKQKSLRIIHCSLVCSAKEINILVEDNGIGMSKAIQERACEMFYRGNEASRGAGIGLYIVKTCTELLDGQLSIESKEGEGTKVLIQLPQQGAGAISLS